MQWYEIVFRILISAVCGIIIGFQREYNGHPAGIKTNAMVCIGAAVISLIQLQMAKDVPGIDPTRIIAQVVSGIGFIGAGCILHRYQDGNHVSGLTTASTLWVVACLGIAIGLGYYLISLSAFLAVLLVLTVFGVLRSKRQKSRMGDEKKEDSE